jgi:hypothetical protein
MRKFLIVFLSLIVVLATIATVKRLEPRIHLAALLGLKKEKSETKNLNTQITTPILAAGSEYAELIEAALRKTKDSTTIPFQIGITSHHLPTAISFIANFYRTTQDSPGPRKTFVAIGPDHFEKCVSPVSITEKPFQTPFGQLAIDQRLVQELVKAGVGVDNQCFENEHSIGVQAIFIKKLFPKAKFVPLMFSATTEDQSLEKVIQVLYTFRDQIILIVSTDFSHYQNLQKAKALDQASELMLKKQQTSSWQLDYVDSPAAIKLALNLAKKLGAKETLILDKANSYDFSGQTENTTGYLNVIFISTE